MYIAGTIIKWYNHCGRQYGDFSEKKFIIQSHNSTSEYIPKRTESRELNKYFYTNVHSSNMHTSQKVLTTHVSINIWTDKQNVVYTYSRILISLKKVNWSLLTIFKNLVVFFLTLESWEFLIYSWHKSFAEYVLCKYFFQSTSCLQSFQNLFLFWSLSLFSYMFNIWEPYLTSVHEEILLYFLLKCLHWILHS